jgi:hypothetical protein
VSNTLPRASDSPSSVTLTDLLPRVDHAQAFEFLEQLHRGASGWILLTLISRGSGGLISGSERGADGLQVLRDTPEYWRFCEDDHARWDAYTAVHSYSRRPTKGERGRAVDALELPGVFADLDVKPGQAGAFQTITELENFLAHLPEYTLRVDTGSGGAHVYWLLDQRVRDSEIREKLLHGWFDYLTAHARETEHEVDHVQDGSRILRVPGTVRWPKRVPGDVGRPVRVTLARANGPRYTVPELLDLTEPYRQVARDRFERHRTRWTSERDERTAWLRGLGLPALYRASLEDLFNRTEDWERLLLPLGWTACGDGRDGSGHSRDCRSWRRPGKESGSGSATTDWSGARNPGVMTLFTTDASMDPCLVPGSGRFEKRVTTKYHFALHFYFNGNEARLLKSIIDGEGRLA